MFLYGTIKRSQKITHPYSKGGARRVSEEARGAEEKPKGDRQMSVISMKQLLEAGVHFGHQTCSWNPTAAP